MQKAKRQSNIRLKEPPPSEDCPAEVAAAEPAEVAAEPTEVVAEVVAAEVVAADVALEVVAADPADMGRLGHSTLWWLTRTNRPSTCTSCKARIPAYEVPE